MVSVTLLMCASLATSNSAQVESEVTGLMHTNAKVEMAVASSGEINVLANKELALGNDIVQFKNVEGNRCLSSLVDKYSRVQFKDCDVNSIDQHWTKRDDDSYESVAKKQLSPAQHLCPRVGAYVNCGRNSTVLGQCPGFKLWYTGADGGFLNLQDGEFKNCLSVFKKNGVVDKGYRNLVVTTPGSTHFCGSSYYGAKWQMISVTTAAAPAIAEAEAIAAATKKAAADAAAAAAAVEAKAKTEYKIKGPGVRCGEKNLDSAGCTAAASDLDVPLRTINDDTKPPACSRNAKGTKVSYNSHAGNALSRGSLSICAVN